MTHSASNGAPHSGSAQTRNHVGNIRPTWDGRNPVSSRVLVIASAGLLPIGSPRHGSFTPDSTR